MDVGREIDSDCAHRLLFCAASLRILSGKEINPSGEPLTNPVAVRASLRERGLLSDELEELVGRFALRVWRDETVIPRGEPPEPVRASSTTARGSVLLPIPDATMVPERGGRTRLRGSDRAPGVPTAGDLDLDRQHPKLGEPLAQTAFLRVAVRRGLASAEDAAAVADAAPGQRVEDALVARGMDPMEAMELYAEVHTAVAVCYACFESLKERDLEVCPRCLQRNQTAGSADGRTVAGRDLLEGDSLTVETAANTVQGELIEVTEDEVILRLEDDWDVRLPFTSIKAISLRFQAADLRSGDTFRVNSVSGREYRGVVLEMEADRAKVRLVNGEPLDLRLRRLDMDTLVLPVSIAVDDL